MINDFQNIRFVLLSSLIFFLINNLGRKFRIIDFFNKFHQVNYANDIKYNQGKANFEHLFSKIEFALESEVN